MEYVRLETIEKILDCELLEYELEARGDLAAQLSEQIAVAKEQRAAAAKEAKAQIDRMDGEMRAALREYRRRKAERPIECEVQLFPADGEVVIVRMDTGEVISRRPARESELQLSLVPPPKSARKQAEA